MYYVYILLNEKTQKYYTGFSSDLKERVKNHRQNNVKTTKDKDGYKLVFYCAF